jgi:hypothetical protein
MTNRPSDNIVLLPARELVHCAVANDSPAFNISGTHVRNGAGATQTFEQAVVHSMHCGIKDAVDRDNFLIAKGLNNHPNTPFRLDAWGIQGALTMTIGQSFDDLGTEPPVSSWTTATRPGQCEPAHTTFLTIVRQWLICMVCGPAGGRRC